MICLSKIARCIGRTRSGWSLDFNPPQGLLSKQGASSGDAGRPCSALHLIGSLCLLSFLLVLCGQAPAALSPGSHDEDAVFEALVVPVILPLLHVVSCGELVLLAHHLFQERGAGQIHLGLSPKGGCPHWTILDPVQRLWVLTKVG